MAWGKPDHFQKHYPSKRTQSPYAYKKATHLSSIPEAFLDTPSSQKPDYQNRWVGKWWEGPIHGWPETPQRRECWCLDVIRKRILWYGGSQGWEALLLGEGNWVQRVQPEWMGLWAQCCLILGCRGFARPETAVGNLQVLLSPGRKFKDESDSKTLLRGQHNGLVTGHVH